MSTSVSGDRNVGTLYPLTLILLRWDIHQYNTTKEGSGAGPTAQRAFRDTGNF